MHNVGNSTRKRGAGLSRGARRALLPTLCTPSPPDRHARAVRSTSCRSARSRAERGTTLARMIAIARLFTETTWTYAELRMRHSRRAIEAARAAGTLIRVRKGLYLRGDCLPALEEATRRGGRLDCLSLLQALGVFVLGTDAMHIHVDRATSRFAPVRGPVVRHWRATTAPKRALAADLIEALAQACRCQALRAAIATLDSAWHLGLVGEEGIRAVLARLPARFGVLGVMLDPRSESGPETLVRLLLRGLGVSVEIQVRRQGPAGAVAAGCPDPATPDGAGRPCRTRRPASGSRPRMRGRHSRRAPGRARRGRRAARARARAPARTRRRRPRRGPS